MTDKAVVESVLATVDDPAVVLDSENRVVECNGPARTLAGVGSEWENMAVDDFFQSFPPLVEGIRDGQLAETELRLEDGERERYFEPSCSPVDCPDEEGNGQVVILEEATSLREIEDQLDWYMESFQTVFDSDLIVLWEQDYSESITYARQLAAEVDDFESYLHEHPEELGEIFKRAEFKQVNQRTLDFFGVDSMEELEANLNQAMTDKTVKNLTDMWVAYVNGAKTFTTECEIKRLSDGEYRQELMANYVPESAADDYARNITLSIDITERKRREEELERKNTLLDEFTKVISHDVATPLGIISNKARLIEQTGDTTHAGDIYEATERVQSLIDELANLAKQGKDVGDMDAVDLGRVTRDAWRTVASEEATLTIESTTTVDADQRRFQQLLENLLSNAVEHGGGPGSDGRAIGDGAGLGHVDGEAEEQDTADSKTGSGAITVGALPDGFYVADDGPGIPAEERDVVFEQEYTTTDDGMGLGLAIVRRIARGHGWDVAITESESGGARFEIRTGS